MRELDRLEESIAGARPVPSGMSDLIEYAYPPRALHEVFMNAVIHRDYERSAPIRINRFVDRLEITSPGGIWTAFRWSIARPSSTSRPKPARLPSIRIDSVSLDVE